MSLQRGNYPGSGFTLWKRDSKFIEKFSDRFNKKCVGYTGGSQSLITLLRAELNTKMFENPFLHFVSPDTKNPCLTDNEIKKWKPAYLHIHGDNSLKRLRRFKSIFEKESKIILAKQFYVSIREALHEYNICKQW